MVKEQLGAIASRAIDMLNAETGGPFFDHVCAPGMPTTAIQNLTLPQIKAGVMQSGLLGRYSKTTNSLIPGACTGSTSEESLNRLVELLTWYFHRLREANSERWDQEKGVICATISAYQGIFGCWGRFAFLCSQKRSKLRPS